MEGYAESIVLKNSHVVFINRILKFLLKKHYFRGSSRGAQLLVYPWPKTGPPLSGMVVLFDLARSFGKDAHGAVREEGDTHLASQISWINPGDQWGDRCRNQITLTSCRYCLNWLPCLCPTPTSLFPWFPAQIILELFTAWKVQVSHGICSMESFLQNQSLPSGGPGIEGFLVSLLWSSDGEI